MTGKKLPNVRTLARRLGKAHAEMMVQVEELKTRNAALEIKTRDAEFARDEKAKLAKSFEDLSLNASKTADIERQRAKAKDEAVMQLKGELADAREEIARLNGYLQRVIEDNIVEELGPRQDAQPVYPPASRRIVPSVGNLQTAGGGYGERQRKAWWSL